MRFTTWRPSLRYSSGGRAPYSLPVQYSTSMPLSARTMPPRKKPSFQAFGCRPCGRTTAARSLSHPVARSLMPAAAPYFSWAARCSCGYEAAGF